MIQATQSRYIIRAVEQTKQSAGGIILKSTDDTQLAEVISIGPQVKDPVPLGAKIVVNWSQTVPLKHENDTLWVVDSRGVLAVLEENI